MIKLNNLGKTFIDDSNGNLGEKVLFQGLNLEFGEGFYALMGNSGYGKTTLVSIIAGLVKPTSGTVDVKGKISFVFQEDRLLSHLTALENLSLVSLDQEKNIFILKSLGLENDINTLANKLSGGMKRRVALGRALTFPHDILILDEPFKGLDEDTLTKAIDLIKSLEKNKTLILITHNQEEAQKLGCQIIQLK